jgi:uncharacterized membrane protein HdeD (DUF308 family)
MTQMVFTSGAPRGLGAAIERLRAKWLAIVAFGILLMALGSASLVFAFASTMTMVTLNGMFFLVGGVAEIAVGAHAHSWGRFFLWVVGGVLNLAIGLLCILHPVFASAAITLALGVGLVTTAVVRAFLALQLPGGRARGMVALGAAVTFLLGVVILAHWPFSAVYVLGTLLGVDLLFHGAGWVSFGIGLRTQR